MLNRSWFLWLLVLATILPATVLAEGSAQIGLEHGIDSQVSMERRMACGINLCQGCAVELKPACACQKDTVFKMCCEDGPVFEGKDIVFS